MMIGILGIGKKSGKRFIAVVGITLLVLAAMPAVGLGQDYDEEYELDRSYKFDPGGTVYLKSSDADVQITGTDRNDVHVRVVYRADYEGISLKKKTSFDMEVRAEDGNLYMEESSKNQSFFIGIGTLREEYSILIEAPRNAGLQLEGDDDNYKIRNMDGVIRLQADDGDADLANCGGSRFEFDIEDGDVAMDGGSGQLKFSVEDGDIEVRDGAFKEVRGRSEDGDVRITTSLADNGIYRFELDDGSLDFTALSGGGTVTIDRDDAGVSSSGQIRELSDEEGHVVYRIPGGNSVIDVETEDGHIHLAKRE